LRARGYLYVDPTAKISCFSGKGTAGETGGVGVVEMLSSAAWWGVSLSGRWGERRGWPLEHFAAFFSPLN
jgi:hypothetical protein